MLNSDDPYKIFQDLSADASILTDMTVSFTTEDMMFFQWEERVPDFREIKNIS